MASYDVRGKVALITGGAQGIGLGIARALDARGAKVALVDLDAKAAGEAAARFGSENSIGLAADVTNTAAIGRAVDAPLDR
jgi:NAD(P)-dependent dehydrogenase (short-subunit alcohol dehydrogenase family)